MLRFKLGLGVGVALGWLIGSGKAVDLLERFRSERPERAPGRSSAVPGSSSAPVSSNGHLATADSGVVDIGSQRHTG